MPFADASGKCPLGRFMKVSLKIAHYLINFFFSIENCVRWSVKLQSVEYLANKNILFTKMLSFTT